MEMAMWPPVSPSMTKHSGRPLPSPRIIGSDSSTGTPHPNPKKLERPAPRPMPFTGRPPALGAYGDVGNTLPARLPMKQLSRPDGGKLVVKPCGGDVSDREREVLL